MPIRHGDTEWAESGRHTGRTDVPLTDRGRREAAALAGLLDGHRFALVLTSPLRRATETCKLAGLGDLAQVRPDLMEWDYGDYEGLTTAQINEDRPGWSLWDDGVPGGETVEQVGERVDRVIGEVRATPGDVALFAHGHVLRILTARWLHLAPDVGRCFALSPAGVGILGYEHTDPVIVHWNESCSEGL
ncbi:MAG TPA: histidine phosphatase family protein [Actinomycetota bacterium]|nr:histidine phosphatase family protein [Actinomycetota bacterium]